MEMSAYSQNKDKIDTQKDDQEEPIDKSSSLVEDIPKDKQIPEKPSKQK